MFTLIIIFLLVLLVDKKASSFFPGGSAKKCFRKGLFGKHNKESPVDRDASENDNCNCWAIESLQLSEWGLFSSASISFPKSHGFSVITGETGAGKSMLLSSLRFISGGISSGSGRSKNMATTNCVVDAQITSKSTGSQSNFHILRSSGFGTEKAISKFNNQHVTAKSLQKSMKPFFRFWKTDEIRKLDDQGFLEYVDRYAGSYAALAKAKTSSAYLQWQKDKKQLELAQSLQSKIADKNGIALLHTYHEELDKFFNKVDTCMVDMIDILESMVIATGTASSTSTTKPSRVKINKNSVLPKVGSQKSIDQSINQNSVEVFNLLNSLRDIQDANEKVATTSQAVATKRTSAVPSTFSPSTVMKDRMTLDHIDRVESFLKKYCKSTNEMISFASTNPSNHNNNNNNMNTAVPNAKSLQRIFAQYVRDIEQVESKFQELGLLSPSTMDRITAMSSHLQEMDDRLQQCVKEYTQLRQSLPDASNFLSQIQLIRQEWQSLAQKHRLSPSAPSALLKYYQSLSEELLELQQVQISLPSAQQQEHHSASMYMQYAGLLSKIRYEAAQRLCEKVNALLPELDMPTKSIKCLYYQQNDPSNASTAKPSSSNQKSASAILSEFVTNSSLDVVSWLKNTITVKSKQLLLQNLFTSEGWDRLSLSLASNAVFPSSTKRIKAIKESPSVKAIKQSVTGIRESLSSGEAARLALALETIVDEPCPFSDTIRSQFANICGHDDETHVGSTIRPILILDEIDAHLGGNAAVAVAKLLRRQGQVRQIFLVSHNPIIAAAADYQLLVQRQGHSAVPGEMGGGGSEVTLLSSIDERIPEIARMLAGNLAVMNKESLARELLVRVHYDHSIISTDFDTLSSAEVNYSTV